MAALTMPVSTPVPRPVILDDDRYEIVRGQRVELPPMSTFASLVATRLTAEFSFWGKSKNIGQPANETLFRLPLPVGEVSRKPDVAFVSYERWPKNKPISITANAWDVVPDVTVEVISPTDRAEDVLEKVEEYLSAGVRQVWVVYPIRKMVHVYESLTTIRGLTQEQELDGGSLLPGFHVKLAALFAETLSNHE